MRIASIRHAVPSRKVTNDEWCSFVRERLDGRVDERQSSRMVGRLRQFLDACGTKVRRVRRPDENAIDFVLDAGRRALEAADADPRDFDFVIYAGVSRGWLEPATANVVQSALGLVNATAFDVLDACASWLRAMQLAHALVAAGTYRRGLIVNCECGLDHYLHVDPERPEDFESRLASFSIGEAATATVVDDSVPDDDFYFRFRTFGDHYNLCMIPLENVRGYMPDCNGRKFVSDRFFADSSELVRVTLRRIVKEFRADPVLGARKDYDAIFSHAASSTAAVYLLRKLRLPREAFFGTHEEFGNTVAASVPLAMSLAQEQGRLQRGQRVLIVIGSAGITVGFATFSF